jgi:hypothetical protein
MPAVSFLRVIHKAVVFCGMTKALVYNGEEEGKLGATGRKSDISRASNFFGI